MINKVKTGKPVTLLYKVIIAVFNAVMLSGVFYTSYHLFHKLIFTKNYSDIYIHVKTVIDYNYERLFLNDRFNKIALFTDTK